jgi:hypothetical protein
VARTTTRRPRVLRSHCTRQERDLYWLSAVEEAAKVIVGEAIGLRVKKVIAGEDGGYTQFEPYEGAGPSIDELLMLAVAGQFGEYFDARFEDPDGADQSIRVSLLCAAGRPDYSLEVDEAVGLAAASGRVRHQGDPEIVRATTLQLLLVAESGVDKILSASQDRFYRLAEALCVSGRTGEQVRQLIGDAPKT